jgi:hypothetical protein
MGKIVLTFAWYGDHYRAILRISGERVAESCGRTRREAATHMQRKRRVQRKRAHESAAIEALLFAE